MGLFFCLSFYPYGVFYFVCSSLLRPPARNALSSLSFSVSVCWCVLLYFSFLCPLHCLLDCRTRLHWVAWCFPFLSCFSYEIIHTFSLFFLPFFSTMTLCASLSLPFLSFLFLLSFYHYSHFFHSLGNSSLHIRPSLTTHSLPTSLDSLFLIQRS